MATRKPSQASRDKARRDMEAADARISAAMRVVWDSANDLAGTADRRFSEAMAKCSDAARDAYLAADAAKSTLEDSLCARWIGWRDPSNGYRFGWVRH